MHEKSLKVLFDKTTDQAIFVDVCIKLLPYFK